MQKQLLLSLFLVLSLPLFGQRVKIPELPDDFSESDFRPTLPLTLQTRLKGVEFSYRVSSPYKLTTDFPREVEGHMQKEERWRVRYRVPLWLGDRLNVILGHSYRQTRFFLENDFEGSTVVGEISGLKLQSNRFTLFGTYNAKANQTLIGAVSLSLNGNYEQFINFEEQFQIYRVIAAYRFRQDENNDFSVGLYFKRGFRSTTFLPFVTWNKTFNDKWGFESVPVISFYMRYNASNNDILLFGYEYLSQDWSVETDFFTPGRKLDYEFKMPKLNFTGQWHHRFLPILWMQAEAGWQYNWRPRTELEGINGPEDNLEILSHGLIFHIGLYLSPPDEWLRDED